MVLNMLPIIGPKKVKNAITTMITTTSANPYSTMPWPFSFGANNITISFLKFSGNGTLL